MSRNKKKRKINVIQQKRMQVATQEPVWETHQATTQESVPETHQTATQESVPETHQTATQKPVWETPQATTQESVPETHQTATQKPVWETPQATTQESVPETHQTAIQKSIQEIPRTVPKRMEEIMARTASITRITKETNIELELNLDGNGQAEVNTGIGFFDHMLLSFARHGFFNLKLKVQGDLYVDGHHTVEDTGIVLGQAIKNALGEKNGIRRYGSFLLPMDETLVMCAVDLSGRPYLNFQADFCAERVGYLDTELIKEFFYAISYSAGINLHLKQMDGSNCHHIIEAMFKAFAKALDEAVSLDPRIQGALSTKGTIC